MLRAYRDFLIASRIRVFSSALLKQLRHDSRPSGLMAGANTTAGVCVKVLVEEHEIVPIRIMLELVRRPMDRA